MVVMLTGVFRYVRHELVADRLAQGWRYAGNLGRTHDQWSVLMWWCCGACETWEVP
jgi:hypothetical protein